MQETPQPPDSGAQPPAPPPPPPPPPPSGVDPEIAGYPLQADIQRQEEYSRFMPLIKWLLAIPHFIVLVLLGIGALLALIVAFFAILFTGRYPRGIFDYLVGVYRWAWRVTAYYMLMVDPYPPFSMDDDPSYPATFDIEYPEGVNRWRVLVHWLLIIPYHLVATLLVYLSVLMSFFAFFTILFTKRYPQGLFNIALVGLRWSARAYAYNYWLTKKYPPFVWG
jgi:Domain of unknown function (DUF4389)